MAIHRYVVADLITDKTIGPLPLGGVSYARRISTQGELSGTATVTAQSAEVCRFLTSRPAALYAYRVTQAGPALWWGGIVWTAKPARRGGEATTFAVQAATFESLPAYRRIWTDLDLTGLDRGRALAALWEQMQATSPTAEARVEALATVVGGIPWPGPGWVGANGTPYSEAIDSVVGQVGDEDAGGAPFEWTIDVFTDSLGQRHRRLRTGTPTIGDPGARHLLTRPSQTVDWELPVDHTARGTHATARGASVAKSLGGDIVPVMSQVMADPVAVAAGRPRVDVEDDSDITDDTQLAGRARNALATAGLVEPAVNVMLPDDTTFSPGLIGDTARTVIVDPFFDGGRYDVVRRIMGVTVEPAERGRPESITLEHQPEVAA